MKISSGWVVGFATGLSEFKEGPLLVFFKKRK